MSRTNIYKAKQFARDRFKEPVIEESKKKRTKKQKKTINK